MDLDELIALFSTIALVIFGFFALFGVDNPTLAIVITGAYIGSNLWIGLHKIAKTIAVKNTPPAPKP
jgi:hypothetical protein